VSASLAASLVAVAGALLAWPSSGAAARRRLRSLHPAAGVRQRRGPTASHPGASQPAAAQPAGAQPAAARPGASHPAAARPGGSAAAGRRRWVLAGTAGVAAALLLGGAPGLAAGLVVTGTAERLLRRGADPAEADRRAVVRDLPIVCDLLAVCLGAGLPVGTAVAAVGTAVPGPLGAQLRRVAGLYRLGAEPRRAWAEAPDELTALGRVVARAGETGSAILPALRALATEGRAAQRAATEATVRRAGVWVLAPLGLCFLPAFVCLGVAPLVLGIARDVFG
jgi:Flp pilus assembly protein TadB